MKPKQLKSPFTWEERRPLISDRIFYVPNYYEGYQEFIFPDWASPEVFGRNAPLAVEYCSGNGAWIIERAMQYPEYNWIAVEMQFERVRKIWSKMHNYQLSNLLIVCGEALTFTRYYMPTSSVLLAYVNFPDPWPKEKHRKNRLLEPPFFLELARVCQEKSSLMIVTDHPEYASSAIDHLQQIKEWEAQAPSPHYTCTCPDYGTSYFDTLFREQGKDIRYIPYQRRCV